MTERNPTRRPRLLAATPSAERVSDWLRTLAGMAGVLTLLIFLFTLELVGRM